MNHPPHPPSTLIACLPWPGTLLYHFIVGQIYSADGRDDGGESCRVSPKSGTSMATAVASGAAALVRRARSTAEKCHFAKVGWKLEGRGVADHRLVWFGASKPPFPRLMVVTSDGEVFL